VAEPAEPLGEAVSKPRRRCLRSRGLDTTRSRVRRAGRHPARTPRPPPPP